jgi:hypothetical protein
LWYSFNSFHFSLRVLQLGNCCCLQWCAFKLTLSMILRNFTIFLFKVFTFVWHLVHY